MSSSKSKAFSLIFLFVTLMIITVYGLLTVNVQTAVAAPLADSCFISVNNSGTTDYASADASALQTAVNAANPDNTLKIAGTCAGVQPTEGMTQTVYVDKNLTLQGGYTTTNWLASPDPVAHPTVLDAQSGGRVAVITGTANTTVENLIISGGQTSADGAGLYVDSAAALTLNVSQIVSNTVAGSDHANAGGGLSNHGQATINGSTFAHNSAYESGSIHNTAAITITGSQIISNTSARSGGALGNYYTGWMFIQTSVISDNYAAWDGGALNNDGSVILLNSTFSDNEAARRGGAVYNSNDSDITLLITSTDFYSNTAAETGGAIWNRNGQTDISGGIFSYNSAGSSGGAIRVTGGTVSASDATFSYNTAVQHGGALENSSILNLDNVTISNNNAQANGGGVETGDSGELTIISSLLLNNEAKNGGGFYADTMGSTVISGTSIISNTARPAANGDGGGLYAAQPITITNSLIRQNLTADYGGGIMFDGNPHFLVQDSAIISNTNLSYEGGGFYIYNNSNGIIQNSQVLSNTADGDGGGIYIEGDNLVIVRDTEIAYNTTDSTGGGIMIYNNNEVSLENLYIHHNQATGNDGGGIGTSSPSSLITMTNATVAYNTAVNGEGGGVYLYKQNLTAENLTISHNEAEYGGGLYLTAGNSSSPKSSILTMTHVTVFSNTASLDGGGLYLDDSVDGNAYIAKAILQNSIIAGNAGGDCALKNGWEEIDATPGYNLDSDGTCVTNGVDNNITEDPLLLALADNGGRTPTHALQPDSPALNAIPAGDNGCDTTILTDQRGIGRPQNGWCDSGAFERIPLVLTGTLPMSNIAHLDWNDTIHDGYELWRSMQPYSDYALIGSYAISEEDVPVDPSQNYYYEVYGVLEIDTAEVSNRVGVFTFSIIAGN